MNDKSQNPWLVEKVAESLTDARTNIPHEQVMAAAQTLIEAKRTKWLESVVEESRAGLADGTNRRFEPEEWERIRARKIEQRGVVKK